MCDRDPLLADAPVVVKLVKWLSSSVILTNVAACAQCGVKRIQLPRWPIRSSLDPNISTGMLETYIATATQHSLTYKLNPPHFSPMCT